MKKIFIVVLAIIAISPVGNAFAVPAPDPDPVDVDWTNNGTTAAYTVESNGSTTAKNSFDLLTETPWIYVKLPAYTLLDPNDKAKDTTLFSTWNIGSTPAEATANASDSYPATSTPALAFWLSPSNWSSIKQVGAWSISGIDYAFIKAGNAKQSGSFIGDGGAVSFSVTPEPISMALFGLGAGVLGLAGVRRKKKIL